MRKRDVLDRLRDMHDVYAAGGNLLERDLRDAIAEIERLRALNKILDEMARNLRDEIERMDNEGWDKSR